MTGTQGKSAARTIKHRTDAEREDYWRQALLALAGGACARFQDDAGGRNDWRLPLNFIREQAQALTDVAYPPDWRISRRADGRIEFVCAHGRGHPPHWQHDAGHGCDGCCNLPDFPGRRPSPGDLAYCGHWTLGLILSGERQEVRYDDGGIGNAYTGLKLDVDDTGRIRGFVEGGWSSRNPIIVGDVLRGVVCEIPPGG